MGTADGGTGSMGTADTWTAGMGTADSGTGSKGTADTWIGSMGTANSGTRGMLTADSWTARPAESLPLETEIRPFGDEKVSRALS